ncbi:ZIP zinc transporter [Halenospora varia]|nr:ZIP zinc transporter [Halenospora varia]
MEVHTEISNDLRGWIMCIVSGIACVVGASIICIDLLVQCIPSKRNFRIQDSSVFLASSLSLSFGVMLFSALYGILPSSKKYLERSGFTGPTAAWILLGCFLVGIVGIQVISRFLHHYIPSHVVDCDHHHEEPGHSHADHHGGHGHGDGHEHHHAPAALKPTARETTPLLAPHGTNGKPFPAAHPSQLGHDGATDRRHTESNDRRPSMLQVQKRVMSFVKDTKTNCDSTGPCYGYSDPCGQSCFKHLSTRTPTNSVSRRTTIPRGASLAGSMIDEEYTRTNGRSQPISPCGRSRSQSRGPSEACESDLSDASESHDMEDLEAQHHHHVPENAFMSIGLQTSIAIAIHKLPEGFITYATNHANPSLGFSVFMALFIHNITEGFAMALPLFLALHSRGRAMFWASLLGGASQPLGAGIAALWFKIAGTRGHAPGEAVYGCMFAVTAGIMTSVALQLFVESLSLNHNRNLCIAFGFIGMAIMGMSNALTA